MSTNLDSGERLRAVTASFIGKHCWAFAAGTGTGYQVTLEFGEPIPRQYPLKNPTLPMRQRQSAGELTLFIQCAWRIDAADVVVGGSGDANFDVQRMRNSLQRLIGDKVRTVQLSEPGLDLHLSFENSLMLSIFCDQTNEESLGNYSIHTQNDVVAVGAQSAVFLETNSERSGR